MSASILLADDDPEIVRVLQKYLERSGYQVRGVTDGHQALAQFQAEHFQVAILDLLMPGISGLELLSRFKELSPPTEVIIFTGHADLESAIEALRRGAYDYLLKPIPHLEGLKALIARALERQRLAQANQALIAELTAAKEKLAEQRRIELKRIRQIGEGLAGALELERIIELLLNLIWETIPLCLLGLKLRAWQHLPEKSACRAQVGLPAEIQRQFAVWIEEELHASETANPLDAKPIQPQNAAAQVYSSGQTMPAVLWAPLWMDQHLVGILGGGRKSPFTCEEQEIFQIFVFQAIAALKNLALFEQVKSMATRDSLTGLSNQRHFWQVIDDEIQRCRRYRLPLSLLFLDLDNFKAINDRYGHPVGDEVLKQVSELLQRSARQTDLLCRYGGEEFVILLIQTPKDKAAIIAERLRVQIAQTPLRIDDLEIPLTVSIGAVELMASMDAGTLVQQADSAMYRAKLAGGNRVEIA